MAEASNANALLNELSGELQSLKHPPSAINLTQQ
jgi:hypothetical protein